MTAEPLRPIPSGYSPSDKEAFMNSGMVEYFRQKLQQWRTELLNESSETLIHLQEGGESEADIADRASTETDRSIELRHTPHLSQCT